MKTNVPACNSTVGTFEECDQHGVAMQVLSTVPVMFSYWAKPGDALDLSRILNDHIAGVVRDNPTRFAGLGTIPLQSPELAIGELHRCVHDLGLRGVQIGTHVNGSNLDDPELFPIFAEAEKIGAAVFVHPWDMLGKDRMTRYWLPWLVGMPAEVSLAICSVIFGGLLERLPRLRLCFAHGGGAFPASIGRIEQGFNVRPDLCAVNNKVNPRAYLALSESQPARFYVDSLVHDPHVLMSLITMFGPQRVALGTDYPFPLGEDEPGTLVESMALTEVQRDQLLFATAKEFLGLDK